MIPLNVFIVILITAIVFSSLIELIAYLTDDGWVCPYCKNSFDNNTDDCYCSKNERYIKRCNTTKCEHFINNCNYCNDINNFIK